MKSIIAAAFLFAISVTFTAAQAQSFPNQVQITPSKTMDIASARFISTKPGVNYIQDRNGKTTYGTFTNIGSLLYAEAFKSYIEFADKLWVNIAMTNGIECKDSATVITWADGRDQALNDGCAFNDRIKYMSRR